MEEEPGESIFEKKDSVAKKAGNKTKMLLVPVSIDHVVVLSINHLLPRLVDEQLKLS